MSFWKLLVKFHERSESTTRMPKGEKSRESQFWVGVVATIDVHHQTVRRRRQIWNLIKQIKEF